MVDAHQHGAAATVVLHQMDLPQRPLAVQRLHGQCADQVLQRGLLAGFRSGQFGAHHMARDVEIPVLDPGGAGRVFHHLLAKAPVLEQAALHPLAQGFVRNAGRERPHAHDHHQVAGRIHAQPGRVDLGHALARQAQHAGGGTRRVLLDDAGGAARLLARLLSDLLGDDAGDHGFLPGWGPASILGWGLRLRYREVTRRHPPMVDACPQPPPDKCPHALLPPEGASFA